MSGTSATREAAAGGKAASGGGPSRCNWLVGGLT